MAPGLGFDNVWLQIADDRPPSDDEALAYLRLLADAARRPFFVHCQSGHGRTSTMCALLRIAQGTSAKDAVAEQASRYGWKPDHDVEQARYVHDFGKRVRDGTIAVPVL